MGASTRAAAFSALRARLLPWCADLFADADLVKVCRATRLARHRYPRGLRESLSQAPPAPWIYTGALENRPELIRQLAQLKSLWGNDGPVLRKVRRPWEVAVYLAGKNIPCPEVRRSGMGNPSRGRWLHKPLTGTGIRFWQGRGDGRTSLPPGTYLQEFISGELCSSVYVADGRGAQLLGVTRQLIGEAWLAAAPFRYCGSIGPLRLDEKSETAFVRLGNALAEGFALRGLFGVDCVLRDGVPNPVEVNPRYTASVEVLEHATGAAALAMHCRVFSPSGHKLTPRWGNGETNRLVGKAIVYARQTLVVPRSGPWSASLDQPTLAFRDFADIPHAGQRIEQGQPILTVFATASNVDSCLDELRRRVQRLDCWLYGS